MLENPMHPGQVLKELYLVPLGMSSIDLANALNLPRTRIERLVKGTTGVTVDTAQRLGRFFSTSPHYWINMQANFDLANEVVDVSGIQPLEQV